MQSNAKKKMKDFSEKFVHRKTASTPSGLYTKKGSWKQDPFVEYMRVELMTF